jgi:Xaa-Pro dipeptidase
MSRNDFTADEFARRLARTRQAIAQAKLDWLIAIHPISIHWLTGSDAKSYQAFQCLFVGACDEPLTLLVRASECAEYEQDTVAGPVVGWGGNEPEDPMAVFARLVRQLGLEGQRVGIEVPGYYLHPHHYEAIQSILGPALALEANHLIPALKGPKSAQELVYVREAAQSADRAMAVFAQTLAVGRSEFEVAAEVYRSLVAHGGLAASTLNLVSGPRAAFSHGNPSPRRLETGDTGNVEFGGVSRRYTVTIGRQFSMGPPSSRVRELFDIVCDAADACRARMRDGARAVECHEAAKAVIARAGYDAYRIHTTGYGIAPGFPPAWGEPVNMFGGSQDILRAGMVVSIEPPIFIPEERIGVRVIDNVLITETGSELLTRFPRDIIVA